MQHWMSPACKKCKQSIVYPKDALVTEKLLDSGYIHVSCESARYKEGETFSVDLKDASSFSGEDQQRAILQAAISARHQYYLAGLVGTLGFKATKFLYRGRELGSETDIVSVLLSTGLAIAALLLIYLVFSYQIRLAKHKKLLKDAAG